MIWRLLKKNISVWQISGYAIANLIGLVIVLSAVRFYGDVSGALSPDDSESDSAIVSPDYLVVSKPVSIINTISGSSSGFSSDELEDIKSQPWAEDVGEFASAGFRVSASLDLGGRGFGTFLFLESIPDAFIDVKPEGWGFDASRGTDAVIPIILSKDYLALYNFGFAGSRGLPQMSENLISEVPIALRFSGNGHDDYMRAKIVGFSSRLNTIAVPEDFMEWANHRYAPNAEQMPSRVIVKVSKPGDPEITYYFREHGYEVAGDKLDTGRASYFLSLITSIVVAIGAVISLLAFFILMLSIFLLLQKSKDKISNLLLLGYTPLQVSKGYFKLVGLVNVCVLVLSVAIMLVASSVWERSLASLSIEPSSPVMPILVGCIIMSVITILNFATIYRLVSRAFR